MAFLYGRAGRLTSKNGGFRPGQFFVGGGMAATTRVGNLLGAGDPARARIAVDRKGIRAPPCIFP
jgi:hypothetical protein